MTTIPPDPGTGQKGLGAGKVIIAIAPVSGKANAVDAVDGLVPFQIDASAVNLSQAGKYPVIYRAEDKSGNRAETTVTVTVVGDRSQPCCL